MTKQWRRCGCITLLMLLLQVSWLQPAQASTNDDKPVWQQSDASGANYLKNRRALVGSGCMVNRLGSDGVKVVPTITNLEYLCDEDLTNVTTIGFGADVTIADNPLVSVRDIKNHYAAGTKAGFVITGNSSSLLNLDVASTFEIMFYCEGEHVKTVAASKGQSVNGVGLSLITISSSEANIEIEAECPEEFDEIRLTQIKALSLEAVKTVGLKYAFVGNAGEYKITKSDMKKYATNILGLSEDDITVMSNSKSDGAVIAVSDVLNTGWHEDGNFIDDDSTNVGVIAAGAALGTTIHAQVKATISDGETFKKGTLVGFKYINASILNLSAGAVGHINLYNKNKECIEEHTLSADVLKLQIGTGNVTSASVVAENDFSRAEFYITTGLTLNVGATSVYYAYVQLQPTIEKHHCDLNVSADLNVCDCDDQYQLTAAKDVTWSVKSQPDGADISVDGAGLVKGLNVAGTYVFTATASKSYCTGDELCTEDVTINYGTSTDFVKSETGLTRLTGDGYTVYNGGNAGISLTSSLTNPNAITSTSLRDYAYYKGGVSLAGKSHIVSVKKNDGATWSYDADKYVGFVVTAKSSALKADLLDFLGINLYKNGEKVDVTLVADNGALTAAIAGSDNVQQRINYVVKVPAGTEFDEIALVKAGTLSVDLSQLNIYYAYISDNSTNPENTGTVVSYNNTGASIDAENTSFASVANLGNTPFGLTNLVDDDLTTSFIYPAATVASGTKVGVKLGRTINHEKQNLLIVTSSSSAVLEASLIDVMKVELYKDGVQVATNEDGGTGFGVLSANVLGYQNTHSYINVSSTKDYDEVVLTRGSGLELAKDFEVYGLILRNDYNADGVPDQSDPEPCAQELVLNEDVSLDKEKSYKKARMIFHRTFNGDAWNSIILPVNLTKAQFQEAFGSDAKLSAVDCLQTSTSTTDNTTTTTTTLVFKTVTDETDGVFMAKNTPYIIKVSSTTLAAHPTTATYESIDDGEVTGSLYIVDNGIAYDKSDNYKTSHSADATSSAFTLTGSYNAEQALEAGSYVFSKGDLYHTTKAHTQKAYRCWITYTGTDSNAHLKGFSVDDDATTSIHRVVSETVANGALYNLMGQRVNAANVHGLYIMGGKKVLVK